jgi:hypothetical protein
VGVSRREDVVGWEVERGDMEGGDAGLCRRWGCGWGIWEDVREMSVQYICA